jgi:uncharacterized protein
MSRPRQLKLATLLGACVIVPASALVWLLFFQPVPGLDSQPAMFSALALERSADEDEEEGDDLIYTGTLVRQEATAPVPAEPIPAQTIAGQPVSVQEVVTDALAEKIYIAIILDDIGNNAALGAQAIALSGAITYAVLPHTPHGEKLALLAHRAGKEVMLHAPMSNLAQHPLGEGGLTPLLSEEEFTASLLRSIAAVPFAKGVNNHMGSELTSARLQMQWLMRELKSKNLYFVDSLTTATSVAAETAGEYAVPNLRRHVFLDNQATFENIDFEFKRLLNIARDKGSAVGIGHPYPETLAYLEQALDTLEAEGIELIPVSRMLELNDH